MPRVYKKGIPAKTHGMSKTRIYEIWKHMLRRCRNPNSSNYSIYGGRGINVCKRWQTFENFFSDMGECPPGHSIERVDNERGYSPENCCWIPIKKQAANRRGNIYLKVNGERVCVAEAARRMGIHHQTLRDRMKGLTAREIDDPVTGNAVLLTFNGETMNRTEWAERLGLSRQALLRRLKLGWSLERALTSPPRVAKQWKRTFLTIDGKPVRLAEVARRYGISYGTVQWRMNAGWSIERILERQ
jgi:predicted DNA-binding protein (UPF0251 family)